MVLRYAATMATEAYMQLVRSVVGGALQDAGLKFSLSKEKDAAGSSGGRSPRAPCIHTCMQIYRSDDSTRNI